MKKQKSGISLIVLVITIIVMIILAGTVILSITSNGIIDKAQEAVEKANLKQIEQIATLGWSEAYLKETNETKNDAYYAREVINYLKSSGVTEEELNKYTITATESGVTVVIKTDSVAGVWTQDGITITNGVDTVYVGDYIDYVATGSDYSGTWQVLGAEDGELLIVSSTNVIEEFSLGSGGDLAESQSDFVQGVDLLDAACEQYGNGSKASRVRSITGEDIDRVAKYDPTTFTGLDFLELEGVDISTISDAEKALYAAMDYGREVTFYWNGTAGVSYKYEGLEESGVSILEHRKFVWYDEASSSWKKATNPGDTITEETAIVADDGSGVVAKITNNACAYSGEAAFGSTTSAAYELLIGNEEENYTYWLASPISVVYPFCGLFGLRAVIDGNCYYAVCARSDGFSSGAGRGVRVVVSLESDIELGEGTEANSWIITNK